VVRGQRLHAVRSGEGRQRHARADGIRAQRRDRVNISPDATHLKIGNELIQFSARFNGVSREVLRVAAVAGIFAKRTAKVWRSGPRAEARADPGAGTGNDANGDKPKPPGGGKPRLQIVK
jgi:stringent starvation protein B